MKSTLSRGLAALALAAPLYAAPAHATNFTFTFDGVFNGDGGTGDTIGTAPSSLGNLVGTPIAPNTPFHFEGQFDTSSGDLFPAGFPFGNVSGYTPIYLNLSFGGNTYAVQPGSNDPANTGLAIVFFGNDTVFGNGHYAAGVLQNPLTKDGAGIIGDWTGAAPDVQMKNLQATSFPAADYFGVGFGSGTCLQGPPSACQLNDVTSVPMMLNGQTYYLTLGNYDLEAPGNGVDGIVNENAFTATVPEPASLAVLGLALTGLAAARRRRA